MVLRVADIRTYLRNDMNILLTGRHGSGKTSILKQACELEKLRVKFFNAATMDPYLELIGIPNPNTDTNSFQMMTPVMVSLMLRSFSLTSPTVLLTTLW